MPALPRFAGWRGKVTRLLLLLVLVGVFLGGVIWAGRWGLEQLRGRERYDVPFADIECEPPAGRTRHEFLNEVRYESGLGTPVNLLDKDLEEKLRAGFAKHRWVEQVKSVRFIPPRRIVVELAYRNK